MSLCVLLLAGCRSAGPERSRANAGRSNVDLLKRYPTKLTAGDTAGENARAWQFTPADVFRVSRFSFAAGDGFHVTTGEADLGIGHCADGAVWAVLIPRQEGELTSQTPPLQETIAHAWLRFHPGEIARLFPPKTVFADGATNLASQMESIANHKMTSSWQASGKAMIPEPKDLTVDVDNKTGQRRFFIVDQAAKTAEYVGAFERSAIKPPASAKPQTKEEAFDQLWEAFDKDYAMFVLRPEVDWNKLREEYRPKALASQSADEFAKVCAQMLKPLRDLHLWLTLNGENLPVFNRPRSANSNPSAHSHILGQLHGKGAVQWAVTDDKIGYITIRGWSDANTPAQFDQALEQMRGTRALIVDVRLNGGGSENLAMEVAGRFIDKGFVYGYDQFRNGASHTNLTEKIARRVEARGPWRYDRPVILLIGQKCMSSNESFVGMMTGDPALITMGDHTCGSSGNPEIINLPMEMTVSVPRWIDYLPDGTVLDEHGFQPQVRFEPQPGAFKGERDDLLSAALERLRQAPLPEKPIAGPAALSAEQGERDEAPDIDSMPPVVARTFPEPGAKEVKPGEVEIRVTFSKEMADGSWSWCTAWENSQPEGIETPHYEADHKTCVMKVKLEPDKSYGYWLNSQRFHNFRDAQGHSAVPYLLVFKTKEK